MRRDSRPISCLVALLMLGVYALLPAAAWMHERIEHQAVAAAEVCHDDHDVDHSDHDHDAPEHHAPDHQHDSSHCQVCLTIHAAGKQTIELPVMIITQLQPRAPTARVDAIAVVVSDLPTPQSPRGPPVA